MRKTKMGPISYRTGSSRQARNVCGTRVNSPSCTRRPHGAASAPATCPCRRFPSKVQLPTHSYRSFFDLDMEEDETV